MDTMSAIVMVLVCLALLLLSLIHRTLCQSTNMKVVALIASIASLVASAPSAMATKCGQWYSSDCVGDSDKRYDPDATNDLKEQEPLWSKYNGFWINEFITNMNPVTGLDYLEPSLAGAGFGRPYPLTKSYYNVTFDGSRFHLNAYYISPPAPQSFCDQPVPPGFRNVFGNGTCGVNGHSVAAGIFGTAKYEKNGEVNVLGALGRYGVDNEGVTSSMTAIDDTTFHLSVAAPNDNWINSGTFVFINDYQHLSLSSSAFNLNIPGNPVFMTQNILMNRTTEADWLAAVQDAYETSNVLIEDRVEGGLLPTKSPCLNVEDCYTEEQWCAIDPECSTSPYQEPNATIKAGPIAGIVVAVFVVLIALLIAFFLHRIREARKSARERLARRVAETITLTPGARQLTPAALAAEFQKIDTDRSGTVSRDELWAFVDSGKAGDMSRREFDVLFSVMDADGNDSVDFLEFCAYMSTCKAEFDVAKNRPSVRAVRPSFMISGSRRDLIAKDLSEAFTTRKLDIPESVQEGDVTKDRMDETDDV